MLSEPWKRLVGMMQALNFGRIKFLARSGEPDFTQLVLTVRTVKLTGGDNGPRPETTSADFEVRKEVISLRDHVAKAANGARVTVEVKYGLPFLLEIQEED
jgi:formyltetrahydrofolate synthetase